MDGVIWQTNRPVNKPLLDSINAFLKVDTVLLVLGAVGSFYAAVIKKDFFFLLWIIPFLVFLYFIGFVSLFHFIALLPIFCISAAVLIEGLSDKISKIKKNSKKNIIIISQKILPYAIISAIGIFGLVSISMLITTDVSSTQVNAAATIAQHIQRNSISDNNGNDNVTVISGAN
jgi:hypothetical protein